MEEKVPVMGGVVGRASQVGVSAFLSVSLTPRASRGPTQSQGLCRGQADWGTVPRGRDGLWWPHGAQIPGAWAEAKAMLDYGASWCAAVGTALSQGLGLRLGVGTES